jgi:hypothetical protein
VAAYRHQQQRRKGNDEKTALQRLTDTLLVGLIINGILYSVQKKFSPLLFLQSFYEKSRIHYLLPILVLVIYSFLGGAIFYTIEVS